MERAFQLNDNVLRSLTLRLDERLVEPMVAHARGETVPSTVVDDDAPSATGDKNDANSSKTPDESTEKNESAEQPVAEEASSES
jgi:small subunit ribosomal protein S6